MRAHGALIEPNSTHLQRDAQPAWREPLSASIETSVGSADSSNGGGGGGAEERYTYTVFTPPAPSQGAAALAIIELLSRLNIDPVREQSRCANVGLYVCCDRTSRLLGTHRLDYELMAG